jgi:hypothetical protein
MLNPEDLVRATQVEIEIAAERGKWTRRWHIEQEQTQDRAAPSPRRGMIGWLRRQFAS